MNFKDEKYDINDRNNVFFLYLLILTNISIIYYFDNLLRDKIYLTSIKILF